jgi:hypothetical protein
MMSSGEIPSLKGSFQMHACHVVRKRRRRNMRLYFSLLRSSASNKKKYQLLGNVALHHHMSKTFLSTKSVRDIQPRSESVLERNRRRDGVSDRRFVPPPTAQTRCPQQRKCFLISPHRAQVGHPRHDGRTLMLDAKQREAAETVFDRNKRREAEIDDALRQEQVRHEAAVKNMHRLRALRLARDAKMKTE